MHHPFTDLLPARLAAAYEEEAAERASRAEQAERRAEEAERLVREREVSSNLSPGAAPRCYDPRSDRAVRDRCVALGTQVVTAIEEKWVVASAVERGAMEIALLVARECGALSEER
jgi:hypothetical protein